MAAATQELHGAVTDADAITAYEQAIPFWQCYLGLERYWEQRRAA